MLSLFCFAAKLGIISHLLPIFPNIRNFAADTVKKKSLMKEDPRHIRISEFNYPLPDERIDRKSTRLNSSHWS